MLFYILIVAISVFLYNFAERSGKRILYVLATLFPVFIEGFRDETIGTDMQGYGTIWFYSMNTSDGVANVIDDALTPEYGYHMLIYIGKLLSNDIHVFLILCAFIKVSAVYYAMCKLRHKINTSLFLLFYFSFFYFLGFSMMRQSIALAICILSFWYLYYEKYAAFLCVIFAAYMFHNSAILMLAVLYLYSTRNLKFAFTLNVVAVVLFFFSVPILMKYLIESPLFKAGIAEYYMDSGVPTAKTNVVFSVAFLLYAIYSLFKKKNRVYCYMILLTSFTTLTFLFLSSYIEVAFRMSYYFLILSVAYSLLLLRKESKRIKIIGTSLFVLLLFLHYYMECTHKLYGTIPYKSDILGI